MFSTGSSFCDQGSVVLSAQKIRASFSCVQVQRLTVVGIIWDFRSQRTNSEDEQANQDEVHRDVRGLKWVHVMLPSTRSVGTDSALEFFLS